MTHQLRLYNTLTRKKEDFVPLDPAHVRMYVCGPTVYDFAHIGNARPVIVFDVLFRLLRHIYGAENVIYTRNITDVDDKINDRAARDFPGLPLNEAIRRVTESTNNQFQADVAALGCLPPTHQPRATEHIEGMKAIIQQLLDKGFAYVAEGSEGKEVLFAVNSMPRYGQLSNRRLDEQEAGARVAVEAHKRNPGDFVLWKQSSADQPGWEATFSGVAIFGRPGWHIECSAMSMAKLLEPFGGGLSCDDPTKNTFDIHGGGIDLVFPHHENEIAQSCCAFGSEKMAQIWMHNGFLQVEGQKMSKSLGNFVTINELLATEKFGGQPWSGEVLRFTMMKTHYRQPIDWKLEDLISSAEELRGWAITLLDLDEEYLELPKRGRAHPVPDAKVLDALADDLNFPEALKRLREMAKDATSFDRQLELFTTAKFLGLLTPGKLNVHAAIGGWVNIPNEAFFDLINAAVDFRVGVSNGDEGLIEKALSVVNSHSLQFTGSVKSGEFSVRGNDHSIDSLINLRLAARAAKNFAESDRIRDELVAMGIQLKDGKDEAGNPITTWEVKR